MARHTWWTLVYAKGGALFDRILMDTRDLARRRAGEWNRKRCHYHKPECRLRVVKVRL